MADREHSFHALAFAENFDLKPMAARLPEGRLSAQELRLACAGGGVLFAYPFGAVVFQDVPPQARDEELRRLRPEPAPPQVVREDFTVREEPGAPIRLADATLIVDELTPARAGIVALTVAQSAAMEYYEHIVERLGARTAALVDRLAAKGTVPQRTRPLHRFIGEAIAARSEVLSVLHLLDKPEATWDDPGMDQIYDDLRDEFDLGERHEAMEFKLRSAQEALELILDVARDRRLVLLEVAIVVLIVLEVILGLLKAGGP
jgi:required for meiotic nuclear division protein 1